MRLLQRKWIIYIFFACISLIIYTSTSSSNPTNVDLGTAEDFHSHRVDLKSDQLQFVYKDTTGKRFGSIAAWKADLKKNSKVLKFAMNGGMYHKNRSPVGLYVEKGHTLKELNLNKVAKGNFYLQPNGVLAITTDNKAIICKTQDYPSLKNIHYATQSGPMLLIDGSINSLLNEGSSNRHIRNAVGLLADGKLLFVMSKEKANFYNLAKFFQKKGCKNALYLDGFVSRIMLLKAV